ncbi:MAG: glutathione S-transferase family protein [Pseudomonadota bacterium]
MLTFWMGKGSSAIAPHILLEEVRAAYETRIVSLPEGEHRAPDYLSLNPKGRVPALVTPEGTLTECPALLVWIGQRYPEAGLIPEDPYSFARGQALASFICSTVHIHFAHLLRGARWSDDPTVQEAMKAKVPSNLREAAKLIEDHYLDGPWALGERYSFVDPYLILVSRWLLLSKAGLDDVPRLKAHTDRLLARPATMRALAVHGLEAPV